MIGTILVVRTIVQAERPSTIRRYIPSRGPRAPDAVGACPRGEARPGGWLGSVSPSEPDHFAASSRGSGGESGERQGWQAAGNGPELPRIPMGRGVGHDPGACRDGPPSPPVARGEGVGGGEVFAQRSGAPMGTFLNSVV